MEKKRVSYIDVAKGIAMIMVLAGHIKSCPNILENWIYSFHIPFFFALSGLTIRHKQELQYSEYVKKLTKSLLVPYLMLSLLLWVLTKPIEYMAGESAINLARSMVGIFIGYRLSGRWYFSMWYILVLFVSELVLFPINKRIERCNSTVTKQLGLSFVVAVALLLGKLSTIYLHGLPWSLDLVPFGIAFVTVGIQLQPFFGIKPTVNLNKTVCWLIIVITLIINISFGTLNWIENGKVDLYYLKVGNYALFIIAAVSGTIFAITLSMLINNNSVLEHIGKNSITYYAFNNALAIPLAYYLLTLLIRTIALDKEWILFILVLLLSLIILSAMSVLINKYLPVAVGKKRAYKH